MKKQYRPEYISTNMHRLRPETRVIPVSESSPDFRWTDETVFARFGAYARAGTCELQGCRIDDPIVYAFPAAHDLKPPLLHWRCFQRAMTEEEKFAGLTQHVYAYSNRRKRPRRAVESVA